MDEDANCNDTLTSTNITAEERKQYQSVTVKLDGFGRWLSSNGRDLAAAIRRESQWNSRLQRDRIVVGIRDQGLSECLQKLTDLTLDKAKTLVRQWEEAHEHQLILRGFSKAEKSLDSVQKTNLP